MVDAVPAGITALSLCYGAYMTEIFRAGIQSIPRGQWEASRALGFKFSLIMRKIILPQAVPIIVPPTGNQFIAMLKDSSLVSVLGVWELMYLARTLGQRDFRHMEMLLTAAMIYWALTIVLEVIQARLKKNINKKLIMETQNQTSNLSETLPIISLNGVNKWYGDFQALSNIDLEIKPKEKIVICGPSGSGKSTLIRCLNRLEAHQQGTIHVSGIELHERMKDIDVVRQDIGIGFQSFNLFPHLTVPRKLYGWP